MKPAVMIRCDECKVPRRLRADGCLVRHNVEGRRCAGSDEEPSCALCRVMVGTERTVSPTVLLCADCDRAVARGDAVVPCTGEGCNAGGVGDEGKPCPVCKGRSVLYVPKAARA